MPQPHPPEFRQRAVELARLREKPVAEIAQDLGISDSCLRNWMTRADIDEGRRRGGVLEPYVAAVGCSPLRRQARSSDGRPEADLGRRVTDDTSA